MITMIKEAVGNGVSFEHVNNGFYYLNLKISEGIDAQMNIDVINGDALDVRLGRRLIFRDNVVGGLATLGKWRISEIPTINLDLPITFVRHMGGIDGKKSGDYIKKVRMKADQVQRVKSVYRSLSELLKSLAVELKVEGDNAFLFRNVKLLCANPSIKKSVLS